ncbi:MAG: bifunctional folylpolyglutamate synthase/dihydrofolate synthase [Prevotella sp.]|nr:bifunctional folylpolyglutamate synthase/dihydrofolate synthase [Prevotella sp.]
MDNLNQDTDNEYEKSLNYLFSRLPMFSRIGAAAYKPGLETSQRLDRYFGEPHKKFKSIHIGGTNGKGSVSHTIAAMLQAEGYKTGLYTSPHLVDFRERIRVNGEMIPKEEVVGFVERWKECDYDGSPSFFELTMMMAFDWFARQEVDYAIIEVGMGGRLDSTNIITPIACVITNISPDHKQFLGDTLEKIAAEKAGIIKSGIPVVIGESEGSIREVFTRKAAEVDAPIRYADSERPLKTVIESLETGGWECTGIMIDPKNREQEGRFHAELSGDYQKRNINTILSAVDMLRSRGITISEKSVKQGFAGVTSLTGLAGRWMKTSAKPLTICDTGHNEAGIRYNMGQLTRLMSLRGDDARLRLVIGFVNDKDVEHIIELFPRGNVSYYLVQASVPRAMPLEQLAEKFAEAGIKARAIADVKDAYEIAKSASGPDDIIYIGGSTFVVADYLRNMGF